MIKLKIKCKFHENKTIPFSFNQTIKTQASNREDLGPSKSKIKPLEMFMMVVILE